MLVSTDNLAHTYKNNATFLNSDFHNQRKKKVLLIDDDQELGSLIGSYTSRKFSLKMTLATDPFEAMNMLTENFYDLIILDWKLPSLTGGQTLQLLEKGLYYEPELPIKWDTQKVPVIIFSSSEKNECYLKSKKTKHFNVVGHVSKKQSLQSIVDIFGEYLESLDHTHHN